MTAAAVRREEPEVPRMLTAGVAGDWRFELWRTPQLKAPYTVFVFLGGVPINTHPYDTEMRGREEMEQMVYRKTMEAS